MFENWIDILLSGFYEVSLPTLTIANEQMGAFTGSGRLIWRGGSDLRVQAATRAGEKSGSLPFGSTLAPGQLIPHSDYLTCVGNTQRNWVAKTDPTTLDGYSTTSASSDIVWDFATTGVSFSREGTSDKKRFLKVLMSPCPEMWTRFTHTKVENEFFGGDGSSRDWLLTPTSFGTVAAKERTKEWFEVFVEFNENSYERQPYEIIGAIGRAFGFFLGRLCVFRGFEDIAPGKITRKLDLRNIETTSNTLRQPLGRTLPLVASIEPYLGRTIDFFLTELGQRVAQYLFLCWDTADNAFPTQLAISSICLEGLLRVAAEQWGPKKENNTSDDIQRLLAWVKENPLKLTDGFIKRLDGMVAGMLRGFGAKEIQKDWVARKLLDTTDDEFKAWSDTRQPLAHGSIGPTTESQGDLQVRITRHSKIMNVINKIVLGMINYQGNYIDYSQPCWPPAAFPTPTTTEPPKSETP